MNVKTTTKQPNKIRRFQRGIYKAAKISPNRRFAVLYDKVYRKDILQAAWQKVRAGGKAAGVDKMTVKHIEYEIGVQNFLEGIENELKNQTYKPQLVRRVNIPKGNGKTRPLGIPTVKDKVVQMAVKLVIEPLFECDFSDCSYGFRPKRSNQQAANEVHMIINHNKWIVDVDLKSYFDTINHDFLMGKLRKRVSDKRILHLIRQWLKAGILEQDGSTIQTDCGTPQGGVLSPLLSNIYLHDIDKLWCDNATVKLVRFADDMVFMCRSERQAKYVLRKLREQMEQLKLELNEDKTKICHIRKGFKFLGFIYKEAHSFSKKRWVRIKFPQPERAIRFQQKVKEYLKAVRLGTPIRDVVKKLNSKLRGWAQYYKIGNSYKVAENIAGYVCMQLRLYWRRCKHRKDIRGTRKWRNSFFYQYNLLYLPTLIRTR